MTDIRRPTHPGAVRPFAWMAVLLTGVALQGCSTTPGSVAAGSKLPVYAIDLAGGAKSCDVPRVDPVAGQTTQVAVTMTNDGGWCGLSVHESGPKPYSAGLLTVRPDHGTILIHEVGDNTRIDYTPDRGFSGNDSFTVQLLPGDAIIHETVAVSLAAK